MLPAQQDLFCLVSWMENRVAVFGPFPVRVEKEIH